MLTVAEETLRRPQRSRPEEGLDPPLRAGDQRRNVRDCEGRLVSSRATAAGRQHRRRSGYSTLSNDAFAGRSSNFMLSNPPYRQELEDRPGPSRRREEDHRPTVRRQPRQ
ncbi:hypothetical protein QJS66_21285 [Kocuria rhizophila]|nr:hypothetical protein QJS66_21285 [Kocuria rhizophila]